MTQAEYQAALARAQITVCAECGEQTKRNGNWPAPEGGDYCSATCARAGERAQGILCAPTPKGETYHAISI